VAIALSASQSIAPSTEAQISSATMALTSNDTLTTEGNTTIPEIVAKAAHFTCEVSAMRAGNWTLVEKEWCCQNHGIGCLVAGFVKK